LSIFDCPLVFFLCCQLLWFVHFWLPLLFSLYFASCSCLSIFDCPFGFLSMLPVALVCPYLIAPLVFSLCYQLLWFVHFWLPFLFSLYVVSCSRFLIFDCPIGVLTMLPVALVCPFLIAPLVFSNVYCS
jgi:hypothetical protein